MKKSLFPFLISTLLFSCSSKDTFLEDKNSLLNEKVLKTDISDCFEYALASQKGEEKFFNRFTLKNAKKEFHQVKVLLTFDETSFYFFGYDKINYTLVTTKEDRSEVEHKYPGIGINFTSAYEVTSLKVLFSSQEVRFVFTANS